MREKFYLGSRGCWMFALIVLLLLLGGGIGALVLSSQFGSNFIPPSVVDDGQSEDIGSSATSAPAVAACRVPELVGQDQAAAEVTLAGLGLRPVRNTRVDPNMPAGQVIAQEPAPNTLLDPCEGDVDIVVSVGQVSASTPTVLATDTSVPPTDTPELTPTLMPSPFADNFDAGLSSEWVILEPGLAVSQGQLSAYLDGILFYDNPGANYRVQTSVKGSGINLLFRATYDDEKIQNAYAFYCDYRGRDDRYCVWTKVRDGIYERISPTFSVEDIFDQDVYHELILEVQGRNFTVSVDGEEFMSVADETILSGSFGIGAVPNTNVRANYDFIELTPLP